MREPPLPHRAARWLPPVALAALTLATAFRAGGYYADAHGTLAAVLLAVLALRVALAERPFGGLSRGALLVGGALTALLAWTIGSAAWSDASGRAVLEGDRVLGYALVFVLFASAPRRAGALGRLLAAFAAAATVVCVAALATRLYPDVFETTPNLYPGRLSWPIGYWNGLGLLAALAAVGLVHVSATVRTTAVRAGATALLVPVLTTLVLTYSRGSLLVAALGLAVYLILARHRDAVVVVLAAAPGAALALAAALRADALAGETPTSPEAVAQGQDLALVVLGGAIVSALLRVALHRAAPRWPVRVPRLDRRRIVGLTTAALLTLAVAAAASGAVQRGLDAFGGAPQAAGGADARQRLLDPSGSSRRAYWDAALDAFAEAPVHGTGAGTYQLEWWEHRPFPADVVNAHSLALETLAELGIAGVLLLALALGGIASGLSRRNVADRAARGLALALLATWLLHALIDWDWQLPVVTLWIFALGGAALARAPTDVPEREGVPLIARAPLAFVLLAAAAGPALVAISELRTRTALSAFAAGDCETATQDARLARRALPLRAEPRAVLGYCAARAGDTNTALEALAEARKRDPRDWQHAYGESILRLATGGSAQDAVPAADRAFALNPLEPDLLELRASLASEDPQTQKRRAMEARLFISGFAYPAVGGGPD